MNIYERLGWSGVICPTCAAGISAWCKSQRGNRQQYAHIMRCRLAEQVRSGENRIAAEPVIAQHDAASEPKP